MIISHFNRYFEKHGRKTYIVLGIIISLMFVVFVTPGDLFKGGRGGVSNFGTMYGKKLSADLMQTKMQETMVAIYLDNPYMVGSLNDHALFQEALSRMRLLHEAKARKLLKVSDEELGEYVRSRMLFQDKDGFSKQAFDNFKRNMVNNRQLASVKDLDRIMAENISIKRLQDAVIANVKVDESEVKGYVEKYTTKFALFKSDTEKDSRPSDGEIAEFFQNHKQDIKMPDSRKASVAVFNTDSLVAKVQNKSASPEVMESVNPTVEEINHQYDSFKASSYKDKKLDEVKDDILKVLRRRKARAYLEKQGNGLSEKFISKVENESIEQRQQRFESEAKKLGAEIVTTGSVTGTDLVPGFPGPQSSLARTIRGLAEPGEVSRACFTIQGPSVAFLKTREATPLPEKLNKEVEDLIADTLIASKAKEMYNEKVAPYASKAPSCQNITDFSREEAAKLAEDLDMEEDERQIRLQEHQQFLQSMVMPFYEAEKRSFSLVLFNQDNYAKDVDITEEMLKEGYEARAGEYQKKEIRLAKIILNTAALNEEEKAAKAAKMDDIKKKLEDGEDFLKLASAESEDKDNIEDAKLVDIATLPKALADKVKELEIGQFTEVIDTDTSLILAKVLERRNGRSLEDVKDELKSILLKEQCRKLAQEDAQRLADKVSDIWYQNAQADDDTLRSLGDASALLESTAKLYSKSEFQKVDKFIRNGVISASIGRDKAVSEAIFKASAKYPLSNAVQGDKGSYVTCLLEIEAPRLRNPSDDERALNTMKSIYRREVAYVAAEKRAEEERDRINKELAKGLKFEDVPETKEAFKPVNEFSRLESNEVSQTMQLRDVYGFLYNLPKEQVGTVLSPRRASTGAVLVYLESKKVDSDDDNTKKTMESVRNYILNRNQQRELGRFAEKLKAESNTQLIEGFER